MSQNQYLSPRRSAGFLSFFENSRLATLRPSSIRANLKNLQISLPENLTQNLDPNQLKQLTCIKENDIHVYRELNTDSLLHRLYMLNSSRNFFDGRLLNHQSSQASALHLNNELFGELTKENNSERSLKELHRFLLSLPKLHFSYGLKEWKAAIFFSGRARIPFYGVSEKVVKPREDQSELRSWLTSFGAGFSAGTVARTSTAPFDRLKFIYQLYYKGSDKPPGLLTGFKEIYKRDGFRGLFRGNFVCILKASPESSIRLTVFEKLKSIIKDDKTGKLSKDKLFWAGGLSGAIANLVVFPMDVLRTRLAAAPNGVYNGMIDAIKKIARTEGKIRPFYKGVNAAMIASLPTNGLNLMLYELFKEALITNRTKENPPAIVYMGLGGASAFFTCSLLYPLQIVTSKMIMRTLLDKENAKKGMIQLVKKIYQSEGIRGFYKGYSPATTKVILGNAMLFGSYEFMKRVFGIEFKKH